MRFRVAALETAGLVRIELDVEPDDYDGTCAVFRCEVEEATELHAAIAHAARAVEEAAA